MKQVTSKTPHKIYAEVLEDTAIEQFDNCLEMEGCVQGALMADSHTGYVAPIGSVLKFDGKVSPALVGYDIGCGLVSAGLSVKAGDLDLEALRDEILKVVPIGFNRHQKKQQVDVPVSEGSLHLRTVMNSTGVYQLGTLGGGNHFIELGTNDETGLMHIIIHSGSRGLGHKVASHYMEKAAAASIDESVYHDEFANMPKNLEWLDAIKKMKPSPKTDNVQDAYCNAKEAYVKRQVAQVLKKSTEGNFSLDTWSDDGKDYMKDQAIALEFAIANRHAMVNAIVKCIGQQIPDVSIEEIINKNHNHAIEDEAGFIIHRKGATQADTGMMGVIPGNMKDGCFIVKGKGDTDSMKSSSHGAGRVLSRKKAKALLSIDKFNADMVGVVTNHSDDTLDEAPDAYKNIYEVMAAQTDLVDVIAHVTPVLNIKG